MLNELDAYTNYYDEQGVEDARIRATGDYGGIGAVSRYKDKILSIRAVLKDSPAEKAGIKPGDEIVKVGTILVSDFDDEGIATLINGIPNTTVKFKIKRQNQRSGPDLFYNLYIPLTYPSLVLY